MLFVQLIVYLCPIFLADFLSRQFFPKAIYSASQETLSLLSDSAKFSESDFFALSQ